MRESTLDVLLPFETCRLKKQIQSLFQGKLMLHVLIGADNKVHIFLDQVRGSHGVLVEMEDTRTTSLSCHS